MTKYFLLKNFYYVSSWKSNPADLSRLYTLFGCKSDSWHLQDFCRRPSWMSRKGRRVSRWRSRGRPPGGSACHQSWRTRRPSSQRRCPGKQGEPSTKVASLDRQAATGNRQHWAARATMVSSGQQRRFLGRNPTFRELNSQNGCLAQTHTVTSIQMITANKLKTQ